MTFHWGTAALISNVARKDKDRTDAIEAARRQIDIYTARIEQARGDRKKQRELWKRREHWVNHLAKTTGKQ